MPVGVEYDVTSCDLGVFVDQAAETKRTASSKTFRGRAHHPPWTEPAADDLLTISVVLARPCVSGANSRCMMTSRCWNAMTVRPKACPVVQVRKAMNTGQSPRSGGWYFYGMKTAIDSAGRVVIPKALRDALGLTAGQPLEITEQDGRLEIVPAATPMRLVGEGDGVAAVADADMPVLTTDMVRDTLERIRR